MYLNQYTAAADHSALQNHHFLSENRLDARPALIPALEKIADYEHKEDSDRLLVLDGDWKFLYLEKDTVAALADPQTDDSNWDTIPVPSMWQYLGYGFTRYPNVEYPFPYNPPYICTENPLGCYRKAFDLPDGMPTDRVILHFGGVDSVCFVYLNGTYVGFSKGSRLPAEFDVTACVKEKGNLLAVKVFQYCDGSYLENQDMLLTSGIFRSVYLSFHDSAMVWDFEVHSTTSSVACTVHTDAMKAGSYTVTVSIDGQIKSAQAGEGASFHFDLEKPRLWNAETPNRYRLTIALYDGKRLLEQHMKYIGLREVAVDGKYMRINGSPIRIKGINRHEHNCKTGKALTAAQIRADLELIKACNLNAIRTSHYTNNPCFYDIATELGIYIMDEADLETHGCCATGDEGRLSKNPDWLDAYLDRVKRMVKVNHNESCVVIRSIGNECGKGENLERCAEYLHNLPHPLPLHYNQNEGGLCAFDLTGYMPMKTLEDFAPEGKPVMLTEYAHAMGNSPGCLYDYWNKIYHTDRIVGGYVWEFKNHGMYTEDPHGEVYYRFGGDFPGDINNWSNFTLDGYLTSDGTPKPAMMELKEVSAPVWAELLDGKIYVLNTNDFRSLDYLTLTCVIAGDGKTLRETTLSMPAIPPRRKEILPIDLSIDYQSGVHYTLTLATCDGNRQVGCRQLVIPNPVKAKAFRPQAGKIAFVQNGTTVNVTGDHFTAAFENGVLSHYEKDGSVLLAHPVELCIYRAPTDNDGITGLFPRHVGEWNGKLLRHMKFYPLRTVCKEETGTLNIHTTGQLLTPGKFIGFLVEWTCTVTPDGLIITAIAGRPFGAQPGCLPRIGVRFQVSEETETAEWLGRGRLESYPDRKCAAPFGLYSSLVADMNFRYDVPQECGSHEDTVFVAVKNAAERGFAVVGCDSFAFSFHDFTLDNLTDARHRNELKKSPDNYLYIDYKMRGLGSHSCGPEPEEKYELHPHDFRFAFVFTPSTDTDALRQLCKLDFGVHSEALSGAYSIPCDTFEAVREFLDCRE